MAGPDDIVGILREVSSASLRYRSLKEISAEISVPYEKLTRLVRRGFKLGLLREYYHVALHKIGFLDFAVISVSQKIPPKFCLGGVKPDVTYYSFTSRPTVLAYGRGLGERLESGVRYVCKPVINGRVRDVLVPVEDGDKIELLRLDEVAEGEPAPELDKVDEVTLLTLFRHYNPPFKPLTLAELYGFVGLGVTFSSFLNHYYRHVDGRLTKKRLVFRQGGSYAIMVSSAPNLSTLRELLNELAKINVVTGVDQVNVIEGSPLISVSHVWVSPQHLYAADVGHDVFNFTSYEIYLIRA